MDKINSNLPFRDLISRAAKLTDFDLVFRGVKPAATTTVNYLFSEEMDLKEKLHDVSTCEFLADPERENIVWMLTPPRPITRNDGSVFVFNTNLINPNDHLNLLYNYHRSTCDDPSDVVKIRKAIYDYHIELGTLLGYPPASVKIFAKELSDGTLRDDRVIICSGSGYDNIAFIAYPESLDEALEVMKTFRSKSGYPKSAIIIKPRRINPIIP